MGTPIGFKLARVVIRLANADLILDGISYPCHHAAFDRGNPLYDIGHSKKVTLASRIEVPLFNLDGTPNDFDRKVKTGLRIKVNSRERKALSHTVRVAEPISFDEGTVAFHVTDTRR